MPEREEQREVGVETRKKELISALVGVSRGAEAGLEKRAIIEEAQVRTKPRELKWVGCDAAKES